MPGLGLNGQVGACKLVRAIANLAAGPTSRRQTTVTEATLGSDAPRAYALAATSLTWATPSGSFVIQTT